MKSWIPIVKEGKILDTKYLDMLLDETSKGNDKLKLNYTIENLHLDKMFVYGVVLDDDKPICCSGLQSLSKNAGRLLSRYYTFNNYRPDKIFTNDIDDYLMVIRQLEITPFKLSFISRETNPNWFKRLKKYRNVFNDFQIYPEKVKLSKNNWQSIFYVGDINYITELDGRKSSGDYNITPTK